MVKKIVSIATAFLMLCCMIPFGVFADDVLEDCPKCGEHTYTKLQDFSMSTSDFSFPISIKKRYCSSCNYTYYEWNCLGITGYKEFNDGGYSVIVDYLKQWVDKTFGKNATASEWTAGGGSTDGSGVGRHPSGYADDSGTPSVGSTGMFQVVAHAVYNTLPMSNSAFSTSWFTEGNYIGNGGNFYLRCLQNSIYVCNTTPNGNSAGLNPFYYSYVFDAPVNGLYYCDPSTTLDGYWNTSNYGSAQASKNVVFSEKFTAGENKRFSKYYGVNISAGNRTGSLSLPYSYTIKVNDIVLNVVPDTVTVNQYSRLTINNNTWNGNIYTDNSTNLTYIYPQYTTINENNETVTNISTNPIIYNNTTNQYYTYDTVTNNFYYITYEEPTPSATPAPTWTPGGGSTRGGGVSRHHGSDSDDPLDDWDDWVKSYYVLNNYDYDAYYALRQTAVDSDTNTPWTKSEKYISTTEIPIANGEYKVTVPNGVQWRAWRWDKSSKTLTPVNSEAWKDTQYYIFQYSEDLIFEFRHANGSKFDAPTDVILRLENSKITEYEPGGKEHIEPTPSPSPEPTETPTPTEPPTPTATPNPGGGGTVPTPGGDSGNSGSGSNNSGSSDSGWNPFKWLTDLLKDIVESILKGLWKLLTSIFGFILWLLSLLFKLFPWMPNSGILALCAGVVVVTIIRIIKFITGR